MATHGRASYLPASSTSGESIASTEGLDDGSYLFVESSNNTGPTSNASLLPLSNQIRTHSWPDSAPTPEYYNFSDRNGLSWNGVR